MGVRGMLIMGASNVFLLFENRREVLFGTGVYLGYPIRDYGIIT
jgi:hypothetical protein